MRELLREVLEVLDRHHGADALERSHLQAMRRLANMPGDPTRRDYWDPGHFTASAFVVSPDRSSLLLIKHKKLGRWLQPGGHIEAEDTTVESAARREVLEETGLASMSRFGSELLDVDVHAIPAIGHEPAHLHHDLRVAFSAQDWTLRAQQTEVDDVRWYPWDELEHGVLTDESVLRATRRIRRLLRC